MSTFARLPIQGGGGGGVVVESIDSDVLDVSGTTAITLSAKPVNLVTQSGGGAAVNLALSPSHHLVLTANCAITLSNPSNGGSYVIEIVQGASPFAVTWASTVLWGPQGAPDFTILTTGQFGIVNIFRDYNNRYVGSYYLGYGP